MGAYPQGNRKARLIASGAIWDWLCERTDDMWRSRKRPDRYKSRYRVRRRFKRLILVELLDAQRSKYMRTIEDVLEED